MGVQKTCFVETVLLSTHNICFDLEIRKKIKHAYLSGGLAKDYSQMIKIEIIGNSRSYLRDTQVPALLLLIPSLS